MLLERIVNFVPRLEPVTGKYAMKPPCTLGGQMARRDRASNFGSIIRRL